MFCLRRHLPSAGGRGGVGSQLAAFSARRRLAPPHKKLNYRRLAQPFTILQTTTPTHPPTLSESYSYNTSDHTRYSKGVPETLVFSHHGSNKQHTTKQHRNTQRETSNEQRATHVCVLRICLFLFFILHRVGVLNVDALFQHDLVQTAAAPQRLRHRSRASHGEPVARQVQSLDTLHARHGLASLRARMGGGECAPGTRVLLNKINQQH